MQIWQIQDIDWHLLIPENENPGIIDARGMS
jgi:hypothetical protein